MKKMLLKLHPPVGCGAEELRLPANAMAETTSNHRAGHSMEGIKNDESRQEPKPKKETPPNLPNELTSSVEPIAEATGKSTPRGVLTVPAANQLEDYPGAEAFPLMSNAELNNLADDIRQNGLCDPIILCRNKILDGRNRIRACKIAGIKPSFIEFCGDDPLAFAASRNLHRRHLTPSQRAAIAAELLPILEKEAAQRKRVLYGTRTNPDGSKPTPREDVENIPRPGRARQRAAKALNVNERYVADAAAIKDEDPKLHEKVKRGEATLQEAKRELAAQPMRIGQGEKETEVKTRKTKGKTIIVMFRVPPDVITSLGEMLRKDPVARVGSAKQGKRPTLRVRPMRFNRARHSLSLRHSKSVVSIPAIIGLRRGRLDFDPSPRPLSG